MIIAISFVALCISALLMMCIVAFVGSGPRPVAHRRVLMDHRCKHRAPRLWAGNELLSSISVSILPC